VGLQAVVADVATTQPLSHTSLRSSGERGTGRGILGVDAIVTCPLATSRAGDRYWGLLEMSNSMPKRHGRLRHTEEASLTTPNSPGRGQSRWELTLTLAGVLLIVGLLGWGIKGWVEMQIEAAAVIAEQAAPLERLPNLSLTPDPRPIGSGD
jgi:hypothetical protein